MPLPKPTLDNRRFDQLFGEGRSLLPRLAPAWTDQNYSDPGITLLDLGAWLSEQQIYRLDRTSDEALRAFVRLTGVEPRMPQVARTVVCIAHSEPLPLALPDRLQVGTAGQALFETTEPLLASPARLVRVLGDRQLADQTAANQARSVYLPFGPRPRIGHALYLGFDRALDAPGATLALHAWTERWQDDAATAEALRAEHADRTAHATPGCPPRDWREHHGVRTAWEFQAGPGLWRTLEQVEDDTRALSLSGFVRFAAPVGHAASAPGGPFYIRCRITQGRHECPPRLLHVALNAVRSEHALSIPQATIAALHGYADTELDLGQRPVVAGSLQLRLVHTGGAVDTDWREAPDLERAGPFDKVVALDPERGVLRGGNGLRAAVLPADHELRAALRVGGGPAGNLVAQSLTTVPATPHNQALLALPATPLEVFQPFAATGGAPRETLAAAQGRAFDRVHAVDKAVTLADIERLALSVPGLPVARVRAVAGLDPLLPCYPAPGVVSVIVIPPCRQPAPLPSGALLRAVERHLAPRRLVTMEIHAIAPRYLRVGLDATLHIECDADPELVLRAATRSVLAFLDPLDGGPGGTGWPFGRTVYRTEILALLAGVAGVHRVTGLSLQAGTAAAGGRCDNVTLCAHELVRPGRVRFELALETTRHLTRSNPHVC
ncbi:MAG: putative rane protein [Ramlibacter sp.]|nr:putative rane protein [Ramlibacter sp.]